MVGSDVFIVNEDRKVLLIQRADNKLWALPGGCHDLGETPKKCAEPISSNSPGAGASPCLNSAIIFTAKENTASVASDLVQRK
jgi:8-oxo-dGTP pyrophosphatase MutT (NUDIX family)